MKTAVLSREADQRGRMKAGAPHPLLSAAFWTAPDERWKPWQQADAPESAKTRASLSSVERLLVPLFSHTNRQGRERERAGLTGWMMLI